MSKNTNNQRSAELKRKRVRRIKRMIILMIILFLVTPTILSVFFMYKVMRLEKRLEQYVTSGYDDGNYKLVSSGVVNAETKKSAKVQGTSPPKPSPTPVTIEERKKVYLTFDDGPSQHTKEILDILKKEKIKATFFVIGYEDEFSKKLYKRIVKEGHTLGMHSYSHIYSEIYKSPKAFEKDFKQLRNYLYRVTGKKSKYYRFPGGSSNSAIAGAVEDYIAKLEAEGVTYLDWNVINGDNITSTVTKSKLIRNVADGVKMFNVSIVQLHDSSDKRVTVKSLEDLIKKLKTENYDILPIDESTVAVQHVQ